MREWENEKIGIIRKRTRNSFYASLIIHSVLLAGINVVLPQLYTYYEPEPKPFPYEKATEVEFYRAAALRPAIPQASRSNALKRESYRPKRSASALNTNLAHQSANRLHSNRQNLVNTYAKLDETENEPLSVLQNSKKPLRSISEPNTRVKTDIGNVKVDRGYASSKGDVGKSRDAQIGSALKNIAGQIVTSASAQKIDVVFLIDTSGSMLNNIHSVAINLSDMISIFRESELDYAVGVVKFKYAKLLPFPLTADYTKYERLLMNVKCGGDERAYNAIVESIRRVKFRQDSTRRFILITDEKLKGSYSVIQTIGRLSAENVTLDIIGLDTPLQKNLARQTGGTWYPVPLPESTASEVQ